MHVCQIKLKKEACLVDNVIRKEMRSTKGSKVNSYLKIFKKDLVETKQEEIAL